MNILDVEDDEQLARAGLAFIQQNFPNLTEELGDNLVRCFTEIEVNTKEDDIALVNLIVATSSQLQINQEHITDKNVQVAYLYLANDEVLLDKIFNES